jgi:hypothetical protein
VKKIELDILDAHLFDKENGIVGQLTKLANGDAHWQSTEVEHDIPFKTNR